MRVRVTKPAHDNTIGKVYETVEQPSWGRNSEPFSVWVVDDVNETYILFSDEYEVVDNV